MRAPLFSSAGYDCKERMEMLDLEPELQSGHKGNLTNRKTRSNRPLSGNMLSIRRAVVPAAAHRAVISPGNIAEAAADDANKAIGRVDTAAANHRGDSGG